MFALVIKHIMADSLGTYDEDKDTNDLIPVDPPAETQTEPEWYKVMNYEPGMSEPIWPVCITFRSEWSAIKDQVLLPDAPPTPPICKQWWHFNHKCAANYNNTISNLCPKKRVNYTKTTFTPCWNLLVKLAVIQKMMSH